VVTDESIPDAPRAEANAGTWSRVVRLIEAHPDVKQVRLNVNDHSVTVGFYETPSEEALNRIKTDARAQLSGEWDVSITPDDNSPMIHLHKIDHYTTEFHRAHPSDEPPVIWKRIPLPRWRNRPFPRPVPRDYRVMLLLAAICGLSTLIGFLLSRAGIPGEVVAPFFALAYVTGGWFATQDVGHALKHGKIDIQFLMVAVALGALFVRGWTEGATLLFLFSLSNALEQFANYRTRKSIESLLKVAPKHAFRRENGRWVEASIEQVQIGDELLVKPGELFPVDGVMIEGATSADESALTGEAIPVVKQIGDTVSGGTLNLDGQSVIRATRRPLESVRLAAFFG
jgi:cation transport ATPase